MVFLGSLRSHVPARWGGGLLLIQLAVHLLDLTLRLALGLQVVLLDLAVLLLLHTPVVIGVLLDLSLELGVRLVLGYLLLLLVPPFEFVLLLLHLLHVATLVLILLHL
jgi:hypothetical protein